MAHALAEVAGRFVALLRDDDPVIGSEGMARNPGHCRGSSFENCQACASWHGKTLPGALDGAAREQGSCQRRRARFFAAVGLVSFDLRHVAPGRWGTDASCPFGWRWKQGIAAGA